MVETSFFHSSIKEPIDERYNVKASVSRSVLNSIHNVNNVKKSCSNLESQVI